MADRTSFVYYVDWAKELLKYPDDLRLKIDDAVKRYVLYGEEPTDREVIYSMFGLMRTQLDRDNEKWRSVKQNRSEAGKKHKGNQYTNRADGTNGTNGTNGTDNVNINVNVNENENVSSFFKEDNAEKKISFNFVSADFSEIFETWINYKRGRGEAYTPEQAKAFYNRLQQLSSGDPAKARQIVEQAMTGNYKNIVQLTNTNDHAGNIVNLRPTPTENIRAAQEAHLRDLAEFIGSAKASGR